MTHHTPHLATLAAVALAICAPTSAHAQRRPAWLDDPAEQEEPEQPKSAQNDQTAAQECGGDRRCRLDRLKRANAARRYAGQLEAERYALSVQRGLDARAAEEILRMQKPISVEFYTSFLGLGLTGGYTFLDGKLRAEGLFSFNSEYVYQDVNVSGQEIYLDGNINATSLGANATYMFNTGWWSPYVTAGAIYSFGDFGTYFFDDFSGGYNDRDMEMHIVQAASGFDVQAPFGLRARLGATLRYPIFVNTTQAGVLDRNTREALRSWFTENKLLGVEFSAGWAF
jgi:opacity protein-like surface antigen